jgi:hypothetical protein
LQIGIKKIVKEIYPRRLARGSRTRFWAPHGSNSAPQASRITHLTTASQSHLSLNIKNIPLLFALTDFKMEIKALNEFKWKNFNYKVLDLVQINNFACDHFPSEVIWEIQKIWILKPLILKDNFFALNDFKWKSYQLQSCRPFRILQLLFRSFLHPRSFEKLKK